MRATLTIASRELRSLFVSPVAYVVLTLWSVIAGTFFLASLIGFQERIIQLQQYQMVQQIEMMNLNDDLIEPFIGSMWVILLFLLPAITMGLVSTEKSNGTDELLLTSPISIWDIVFGKFVAGTGFVTVMTAIVAFFPALLFAYGEPELGKTITGLVCLLLVSVTYVAVGLFAPGVKQVSVTLQQVVLFRKSERYSRPVDPIRLAFHFGKLADRRLVDLDDSHFAATAKRGAALLVDPGRLIAQPHKHRVRLCRVVSLELMLFAHLVPTVVLRRQLDCHNRSLINFADA